MAFKAVTVESTAELCARAARACAASRKTVLEARDSVISAKARANHSRRKADADDPVLLSLLAG